MKRAELTIEIRDFNLILCQEVDKRDSMGKTDAGDLDWFLKLIFQCGLIFFASDICFS